jgi:rhodanese-related sulfurtransferase
MRMAVATLLTALITAGHAFAQDSSIEHATLGEKNAKTPEISTAQVRQILDSGGAMILDTRSRAEFEAGHIPGAQILDVVPDQQIAAAERLVNGNKAAALVLYCNGPYCQASRRLAERLTGAGFTNVRRYQLGIPVWRALGGPTAIEPGGVARVYGKDRTAVYLDARSPEEFAKGSLPEAHNTPADDVVSGKAAKMPLPEDDFNRRIILFGRDAAQARKLAEYMSKRPWHNVAYVTGSFEALARAINIK